MELTLPRPHPAQYQVLRESKRFNALCMGRRWGKTTLAIDRAVRPALRGKPVAWFAPTYKLLTDPWQELQSALKPITTRQSEQEHWLQIIGGGKIECWSLDKPDAGRGRAYARIIIDEAALVPDLEQAWEQTISPMLADYSGSAWFLSTPKGVANYFHTLYQRGQDPERAEWASWQMPTSTNPHIKASELEIIRGNLTDLAYAQEIEAQFVTWAGSVFRRITDAIGAITKHPAAVIGVDWGRTGDFTVFTALSSAGQLVDVDRFRGVEYALQRARLAEFWRRNCAQCWIVAEANSMGGPVIEQLQADGLPVAAFQTTAPSKAQIIQQLALAFERGTIRIPNDPVLIGELQAFEGKPSAGGLMRYGAPAGIHDDSVMSLAIAWSALVTPREQRAYLDPRSGDPAAQYRPYEISPI